MQPLDAHQITVKFYADESSRVDPDAAVTIFHRWIQEERLKDEIPIDVADYRHVGHGPGVVLVCHAADYALWQNGRPSLFYSRKRASDDDPVTRLGADFRAALTACRFLAPSTTACAKTLAETLHPFLDRLYQGCERLTLEADADPKNLLCATARVQKPPDAEVLLSRLRA